MPSKFQQFSGKRCLITGGAGFIGSHIARRLVASGAQVSIVDSMFPEFGGNMRNLSDVVDKIAFHQGDIRDRELLNPLLEPVDFLFNLAGQTSHLDSMTDPVKDLEINALAQLNLLESVRRVNPNLRIVYASTRQIYGRPDYLPVDENHPLRAIDVNGINKIAGESFHLLYHQVYGLKTTCLRLTNTYGPGMRVKDARQTFLGTWIKHAVDGQVFEIFGDGAQRRDFNFVDDVVDAFLLAATKVPAIGKAINLGGRETISLTDLAGELVRVAPESRFKHIAFPPDRKAIDIGDYYGSWAMAQEVLEWVPRVGLAEGLTRTLDYYRENKKYFW